MIILLINTVVIDFAGCHIVWTREDVFDAASREVYPIYLVKQWVEVLIRQIVPDWECVRARIVNEVDVVLPREVVKFEVFCFHRLIPEG
jgi:hypothetical protein